jgi:tetratricopeptide (TPR) repeat protein
VAPRIARPAIELSGPHTAEDKEFIEEHLAEGKVFRKYGLVDKAVDQFEAVVARFPDNVDARQELKELFKEKGQAAKIAEQCLTLAEIFRLKGDAASAQAQEDEARVLAPESVPAPVAAAPVVERPAAAAPAEIPVHVDEEIPVEVEEAGIEPPAAAAFDLGVEPEAGEEELPIRFIEEPPAEEAPAPEAGFELEQADEEVALEPPAPAPPKPAPPRPAAAPPAPPKPAPAPAPRAAAPAPAPPARPAARSAAPPPAPAAKAPRPEPRAAAPSAPADLVRALEEVEQYVSLGFVDDARDALHELSARYPGNALLAAKVAELGLGLEPPAAAEQPAAPAPADAFAELGLPDVEEPPAAPTPIDSLLGAREVPVDDGPVRRMKEPPPRAAAPLEEAGGLDLGSELGDLFGAQSAVDDAGEAPSTDLGDSGLADIFKEFKKGVDKQLGKEDYDTRYNLGIAYKEMGLVDEAIAEFQLAAKDESRMLECASMLGICFLEKGMPKLAVKWFEKGLNVPGRSDEEYQGLRYDLAVAHEASGETDKALTLFTDLYGQDANFRDVAAKVRELGGGA